eukprot:65921_1
MASFISDSKSDESTKNLRRHSFPESSVEISGVKNLSKDVYSKQESPVQVQNVATSPAVSSETHSDKVAVDECTSETKTSPRSTRQFIFLLGWWQDIIWCEHNQQI